MGGSVRRLQGDLAPIDTRRREPAATSGWVSKRWVLQPFWFNSAPTSQSHRWLGILGSHAGLGISEAGGPFMAWFHVQNQGDLATGSC